MQHRIEFWYEFASTYSYLSAMRVERMASAVGIAVKWRPFLLGPIFKAQGWSDSPFKLYEAKGAYMWRDMERLTRLRGLDFRKPRVFPANGLLAARVALLGSADEWIGEFTRRIFLRQFVYDEDISQSEIIAEALDQMDLPGKELIAAAEEPAIKMELRQQTIDAQDKGIFGAPSFVTPDNELFWGDDRLELALNWMTTQ